MASKAKKIRKTKPNKHYLGLIGIILMVIVLFIISDVVRRGPVSTYLFAQQTIDDEDDDDNDDQDDEDEVRMVKIEKRQDTAIKKENDKQNNISSFLTQWWNRWMTKYRKIQLGSSPNPAVLPSPLTTPVPIPTIASNKKNNQLDIAICDPSTGPYSITINNPFFPLPVGKVNVLESSGTKVQVTVLNQTENVAGVTTRVVEEREWENGNLIEVSRNFFAQSPNGSVCYFGEDVDIYTNGQITAHDGAWRAGVGQNKPGIFMPANPSTGQIYYMEWAPGVATDLAEHTAMNQTFTTPAGTFNDVLFVTETPASTKYYQRGIGLIYDAGTVLTSYH